VSVDLHVVVAAAAAVVVDEGADSWLDDDTVHALIVDSKLALVVALVVALAVAVADSSIRSTNDSPCLRFHFLCYQQILLTMY